MTHPSVPGGKELRAHPRYELYATVELIHAEQTLVLPAINISRGGLMLRADGNQLEHIALGTMVNFALYDTVDRGRPAVRAEAKVVRNSRDALALSWASNDSAVIAQITSLLERLTPAFEWAKQRAAARSPRLAPTPVPAGFKAPDTHRDAAGWDEYLKKRGDELATLRELGHYMLTVGYIFQRQEQPLSVLDLGCGTGKLFEVMSHQAQRIGRYVGLDISPWGIEKAQKRWTLPNVEFQVADLYTWEPKDQERFDRIVFCESLQCLEEPTELMRKYAGFLADDGYIVASVFELENRRTEQFWREAEQYFFCIDAVTVRHDFNEFTWHVRMFEPR